MPKGVRVTRALGEAPTTPARVSAPAKVGLSGAVGRVAARADAATGVFRGCGNAAGSPSQVLEQLNPRLHVEQVLDFVID